MRQALLPVLVLVCLLPALPPAAACTRPYESPEHVLSRACYIAELEVLSVTAIEGAERGERARATVRVLRELRGKLPLREFTLLGGRIDSCAFFDTYLSFTPGERLFLFLEAAVPEETRIVRIFRAPRVFRGTAEEIESMLERVHRGWLRRIELLTELAPAAMVRARALAAAFRTTGAFSDGELGEQPVEVLLALRELLLDPAAPLPRPAPQADARVDGFTTEPAASGPAEYVATRSGYGLPRGLSDALTAAITAAPAEAAALRHAFLVRYLTKDLLVPEARAEHFLAFLTKDSLLHNASFPSWLRLTGNASPEAREVLCLMKLADPMPDWLVKQGGAGSFVDRALLAAWLERNASSSARTWSHLCVYFAHHLREARPAVMEALANERIPRNLEEYFDYFLRLGDRNGCLAVAEVAERLLAREDHDGRPEWLEVLIRKAASGGPAAAPARKQLGALR